MTFTYCLPVQITHNRYEGLFIVNISPEHLLDIGYNFSGNAERQILIANSTDTVFSSEHQILSSEEQDTILKHVFHSDDESGQYIYKEANLICSWKKTEDSSLYFISCIPYTQITQNLNSILVWFILFYVVFFLFTIAYILSSFRHEKAYTMLEQKYKQTNKRYLDNYTSIKNSILRNYFSLGEASSAQESFHENGILLEEYSSYSASLFIIKQKINTDGIPSTPYPMLYNMLMDVFKKYIPKQLYFELVDMLQGTYLLISEYTNFSEIKELYDVVQQKLGKSYHFELSSLGIGKLEQLPKEYRKLSEKMDFLFFYPHNSCLDVMELNNRKISGYEDAVCTCNLIINELQNHHFTRAQELLTGFFNCWFESYDEICKTLNYFCHEIYRYIESFKSVYTVSLDFDVRKFSNSLRRCNTSQRAHLLIENLITDISVAFESIDSRSSYVEDLIQYIETNYSDINLNVNNLADAFGVSASYVQNIFKTGTGTSISSYLRKTRLQKAAELLLETNEPINEIALKVGLDNPNYFYTVFKKYYSITPSEYRNRNKKN